ncbi:MAG: aquaporin family protein [Clostridiales bacterium]|nr:aquaporin family protein [Clostridiales bacterium]
MEAYLAELLGTMVLVLLGDGVVANVLLNRTKGQNSGWIVITAAWGFAVMAGVFVSLPLSGAHINPAVTIGFAAVGLFPWSKVAGYIIAQLIGAFLGAILVYLAYVNHFAATEDKDFKLMVFSTMPNIRNTWANFMTELIGTAMLLFGVLAIIHNEVGPGLVPLLIGILVWGIGLSLGGPTGYAINPARDLGPRIAHALLPIPGKRDSDWGYAWIPVVAPIVGGILGAWAYMALLG